MDGFRILMTLFCTNNLNSGLTTLIHESEISLTLFKIGGREGGAYCPTSFFPVRSTNLGISPQSFLTFSFNPFVTLA